MAPTFIKATIMTNEEILRVFLEQKRLYESFCEQRKEPRISMFGSDKNISSAIDAAFIWGETKEGHNYWRRVSLTWKNMCRDLRINGCIKLMEV